MGVYPVNSVCSCRTWVGERTGFAVRWWGCRSAKKWMLSAPCWDTGQEQSGSDASSRHIAPENPLCPNSPLSRPAKTSSSKLSALAFVVHFHSFVVPRSGMSVYPENSVWPMPYVVDERTEFAVRWRGCRLAKKWMLSAPSWDAGQEQSGSDVFK